MKQSLILLALLAAAASAGCSTQNLNVSWNLNASYNTNARVTTDTTVLKKGE